MASHISSLKSVLPYIRLHAEPLLGRWDKLAEGGKKGLLDTEAEDGRVWYYVLPCESTLSSLHSAETD